MMNRSTRTIEVFDAANAKAGVRVEVEGQTVSVQVVEKANQANKFKFVCPKEVAILVGYTLTSALAQEGGQVVEQGLVRRDADPDEDDEDDA